MKISRKTDLISQKHISYLPERRSNGLLAGSGYIRTVIPFEHLESNRKHIIKQESKFSDVDFLHLDILLIQRTSLTFNDTLRLAEIKKVNEIKVFYEIDDDLITHFEENDKHEKVKIVKSMLILADRVIVATNELKDRYLKYNSNISVIENSLDLTLWNKKKNSITHYVNILYMGTYSHKEDLKMIEDDLRKLKQEFQNLNIDFIGITDDDNYLNKIGNIVKPPTKITDNYKAFVNWLCENNCWHIGIAPLEDSHFNKTKSHIKFLDYTAMGLATVCSNVKPYNKTITNNTNAIMVDNKPGEWYSKLKELILDCSKISELQEKAELLLKKKYNLNDTKKMWSDLFNIN